MNDGYRSGIENRELPFEVSMTRIESGSQRIEYRAMLHTGAVYLETLTQGYKKGQNFFSFIFISVLLKFYQ